MSDVHQPHDRLFRSVFSDPSEAAQFLQEALPPSLRDRFQWPTLALKSGTFIDHHLQASQSDRLYEVLSRETGQPLWMYLVLEHVRPEIASTE